MTNLKQLFETGVGAFKGTRIVSIDMMTPVALLGGQKNPMKGLVFKYTTGVVMLLGYIYDNAVKKQLSIEATEYLESISDDDDAIEVTVDDIVADWKPKPLSWGEHVDGLPFITHKGNAYLHGMIVNKGSYIFMFKGKEIQPEDIEGLKTKPAQKADQGGISKKIEVRSITVENIAALRVSGEEFENLSYT